MIDPADNTLLGAIHLGEPLPANLSPLYKGQLLVHGMGFSPDHRTLVIVAIGSNAVTFIDTTTNAVKHITYVGRSPHEPFFTPDGTEVWVTVRGENYVAVQRLIEVGLARPRLADFASPSPASSPSSGIARRRTARLGRLLEGLGETKQGRFAPGAAGERRTNGWGMAMGGERFFSFARSSSRHTDPSL